MKTLPKHSLGETSDTFCSVLAYEKQASQQVVKLPFRGGNGHFNTIARRTELPSVEEGLELGENLIDDEGGSPLDEATAACGEVDCAELVAQNHALSVGSST